MDFNDGRCFGTPWAPIGCDQAVKFLPSTPGCLPTSSYFSSLRLAPCAHIHGQLPCCTTYFALPRAVHGSPFGRLKETCQVDIFCLPYKSLERASRRWQSLRTMPNVESVSTDNHSLAFFTPRLAENLFPLCHHTLKCQTWPDKKSRLPTIN